MTQNSHNPLFTVTYYVNGRMNSMVMKYHLVDIPITYVFTMWLKALHVHCININVLFHSAAFN